MVSQPFSGLPSQLPKPRAQLRTWQVPPTHLGCACASTQALLQAPQLLGFVSVFAFCVVAPIATALAPLGVRLAHRFTRDQLRIGFGMFLILVSLRFLVSLFL